MIVRPLGLILLISLAFMAQAQTGKKAASIVTEPEMLEINALLFAPNGGFKASEELLMNSFALRRDWQGVETPLDLSNQYASYNTEFAYRATAGGSFYHLAHAMHLLDELDSMSARYRLAVLEMRLLWVAGNHAKALQVAQSFLAQSTLDDVQMTSILADAAILEHFLGDPKLGQSHLERARACRVAPQPSQDQNDFLYVSRVLSPVLQPSDTTR